MKTIKVFCIWMLVLAIPIVSNAEGIGMVSVDETLNYLKQNSPHITTQFETLTQIFKLNPKGSSLLFFDEKTIAHTGLPITFEAKLPGREDVFIIGIMESELNAFPPGTVTGKQPQIVIFLKK